MLAIQDVDSEAQKSQIFQPPFILRDPNNSNGCWW